MPATIPRYCCAKMVRPSRSQPLACRSECFQIPLTKKMRSNLVTAICSSPTPMASLKRRILLVRNSEPKGCGGRQPITLGRMQKVLFRPSSTPSISSCVDARMMMPPSWCCRRPRRCGSIGKDPHPMPSSAFLTEHYRLVLINENAVLQVPADCACQHHLLQVAAIAHHVLDGIAMRNPDHVLLDDWSFVQRR